MNELTTQGAESDYIEGTFRNAEDPPPVERVVARGYATLPPRPSPPPPPAPRPPRVQPKKKPISPYVPDWYCYMCYVMVVVVVLFFIAIFHL